MLPGGVDELIEQRRQKLWGNVAGSIRPSGAIEIDLLSCVTVLLDCGIGPGARPGTVMEVNTSAG